MRGGSHDANERAPHRRTRLLLVAWCLSGCMRFGYDLLTDPAEPFEDLTPSSVTRADESLETDAGAPVTPSPTAPTSRELADQLGWDSRPDRRDRRSVATELPRDAGARDASAPPQIARACQLTGNEVVVNGFDSPAGGLQARGPGNPTLNWIGSEGNPAAGALDFQNDTPGGGDVYYPGSLGDLNGRIMSLNVQVASGTSTRVRLFVESGQQRRRANAAFFTPPVGQWDCAQLALDDPDSSDPGFDPANIVGAGLEIEASGRVEVYVDQIAY